jgi:hypothetical protein
MSGIPDEAGVLYRLARQDRLAYQTLLANPDIDFRIVGFHAQQAGREGIKGRARGLRSDFSSD